MKLVLAVFVLAFLGCNSKKFDCCLNQKYYKCANQQEFDSCKLESGPGKCQADASKDATCPKLQE